MRETLRPLIESSMKAKPTRKKNEIDPEQTIAVHEKTVSMAPPRAATEETVEIAPPAPATAPAPAPAPAHEQPDLESTIRIPPPQGSKDARVQEDVILASVTAATPASTPTPAPQPEPALTEFASPAPAAAPEPPPTE